MTRDGAFRVAAVAVLGAAWLGPLPRLADTSFAAHMALHMTVVAIAAPLLALGLPRLSARLAGAFPKAWPALAAAPVAAGIEMAVVWGWHTPSLCVAARSHAWVLVAEQLSWLAVGLLVWISALGALGNGRGGWGGVLALFLTSMHMTLLGALIVLSPRVLYEVQAALARPVGLTTLADQQLGGMIMLAVGGVSYLAGGLFLMGRLLDERRLAT